MGMADVEEEGANAATTYAPNDCAARCVLLLYYLLKTATITFFC